MTVIRLGVMTALGQLAPECLVVQSNPSRLDRMGGGAVAEDIQVSWIGDNVRLDRVSPAD